MIMNASVKTIYGSYPPAQRKALLNLRDLVLETAKQTDGVGEIE